MQKKLVIKDELFTTVLTEVFNLVNGSTTLTEDFQTIKNFGNYPLNWCDAYTRDNKIFLFDNCYEITVGTIEY